MKVEDCPFRVGDVVEVLVEGMWLRIKVVKVFAANNDDGEKCTSISDEKDYYWGVEWRLRQDAIRLVRPSGGVEIA